MTEKNETPRLIDAASTRAANKIADLFTSGFFDDRMIQDVASVIAKEMRATNHNALSFTANGGPAFPLVFDFNDAREIYSGMTMRDWFAGMAMQALITRVPMSGGERARDAYIIADAMIKERNK